MNLANLPKTRAEASRHGIKHFYTGEICPEGHQGACYTSNGSCVGCARQRATESARRREKTRRPKNCTPKGIYLGADWRPVVMA